MKKVMTFALAVFFVSSVQAITWTKYAGASGSVETSQTIYADSSGTIAALISYGAEVGSGTLFSLRRNDADTEFGQVLVGINEDGYYTLTISNASTITTTTQAQANTTDAIVISVYRLSYNYISNVNLYVNGELLFSATNRYNTASGPMKYLTWGTDIAADYEFFLTHDGINGGLLSHG